jgi:hypothetical protein
MTEARGRAARGGLFGRILSTVDHPIFFGLPETKLKELLNKFAA